MGLRSGKRRHMEYRRMTRADMTTAPVRCCSREGCRAWCRENLFLVATIIAVILGLSLGMALRQANLNYDGFVWISIWGEVFMRILKAMIIPLSTTCIVVGVAGMEAGTGGKLVAVSLGYIYVTQAVAVFVGILLTKLIHPGTDFGDYNVNSTASPDAISYTDVFGDFIRNLFPDNIVQACLENAKTEIVHEMVEEAIGPVTNGNNFSAAAAAAQNYSSVFVIKHKLVYKDGPNLMGLIVASVAVAVCIRLCGKDGKPFLAVFESMNKVFLKLMDGVIWTAPVGIVSLIAGGLLKVEDLSLAFRSLGMLALTTLVGQIIHAWIILPLLFVVLLRKNPFSYLVVYLKMVVSASAATSSAVAFPFMIRDSEEAGLDPVTTKFFAPLAVTMNRDGSAMFIAMATLYVAQTYGISLGVGPCFVVGVLVTFLCGAVAMVPSSSIVILLVVANAVDIPIAQRLGLLLTVDWLLDRMRTSSNIVSHGYGCVFVDHYCGRKSRDLPYQRASTSVPGEDSSASSDGQADIALLETTRVDKMSSTDSEKNGGLISVDSG